MHDMSAAHSTFHASRPTPHGASRLVQAVSAWSAKTRRATSRLCRDARVYGHTPAAMHDMSKSPPHSFSLEKQTHGAAADHIDAAGGPVGVANLRVNRYRHTLAVDGKVIDGVFEFHIALPAAPRHSQR